ncbi:MAG: hypothetical protein IKL86_04340 [Clostridia bacterium]|nr:hypothetical protein [Clostridia bacterium]
MKSCTRFKFFIILYLFVFFICIFGSVGITAIANQEILLPNYITENELLQFTARDSSVNLKLLYNINDQPEYILAYPSNNVGYEIYNRITGALLESNDTNINPFLNVSSGYFISPFNYAKKDYAILKELKTGHKYTNVEKNSIQQIQKRVQQQKENYTLSATSTNLDLSNTTFAFDVAQLSEDYTLVSHPELFYLWDDSDEFGNNTSGSCEAVALTLLFKYADYLYGGLIPQLTPQSWADATYGKTVLEAIDDTNSGNSTTQGSYSLTMQDITNPSNTIENLHKYLIHLSGVSEFGLSFNQKITAFNTYANEIMSLGCINISLLNDVQNSVLGTYETVKYRILNNDMPSQISIYSAKSNNGESYHSVVAYGVNNPYPTTNYYFSIHTGWSSPSNCIINGEYLIIGNETISLNVSTNPTHNIYFNSNNNTHACNNTICYSNGVTHRYYSGNTDNNHSCICGISSAHTYTTTNAENYDINDMHYCDICGEYGIHNWEENSYFNNYHYCTICNYTQMHTYTNINDRHLCLDCSKSENCIYSYSYLDDNGNPLSSYHKATCTICNNVVLKEHEEGACTDQGLIGHSVSCNICNLVIETSSHTYEKVYYDATYHRSECTGCGRASTKSKHTYESYLGLFVKCSGCGHTLFK